MLTFCVQNQCGSSQGDDGSVLNSHPILGSKDLVHQESAGDAVIVAQRIDEASCLASLDIEDAVAAVHARVVGLNGYMHLVALVAATDDIVAQLQRMLLTETEDVLYGYNTSYCLFLFFYGQGRAFVLLALQGTQLAHTDAYAKLFLAIVTYEHERLPLGILGLVELDEMVALGATYSFHVFSWALFS